MSTRRFVSVIVTALVIFILVVSSVGLALADEVRSVEAVITAYSLSSFGDLEIEAVDAEGNVWAYYADEAHIGDLVILTIYDFEELSYEDDEIVDVITIGRLNAYGMINWLK